MLKKNIVSILFLFTSTFLFSQQNFNLSGKMKSEDNFLKEILLELQIKKVSKFAVTTENGDYKFTSIFSKINDTLILKINYTGYKPIIKSIVITEENMKLDVDLSPLNVEILKEVVIKAEAKSTNSASKSIFKINQKDFIKDAKATEVLGTLPNVFYNKQNDKTIVEGTLTGKIFIDGIEAMSNELKGIGASSIDKVEVMSNPSSVYGTEFLGAIVNIITKKTKEQFIKGSLKSTVGVKNNHWSISPSFVYKKGIVSFKSEIQYLQFNQIVTEELVRKDFNGNFMQNFVNNFKTNQNYINSKLGLKFSKKSDVVVTGYYGVNGMKGNVEGTSTLNSTVANNYNNQIKNTANDFEIASIFKNEISDVKSFYFKNKYAVLSNLYESEFKNQALGNFDVSSKNKELTLNLGYNIENLKILKKQATILYDLKYINRVYSFSNSDFYLNQNIFNATFDMNNDWSKKISTHLALTFEESTNKSDTFLKKYNLILPTFNFIYHFKNKIDVKLSYSKRVLRPNPTDLNETLIISSPGSAKQGNSNLEQQIKNTFSFKLNKEFESDNLSIKFYRTLINNSIVNVFKKQGDFLITTVENAAKFNITGVDVDFSTRFLKKIDVNFNSGINYNIFETSNPTSIIKKNEGTSFNSSINLYTNFFKDKVSVSFSGMINSPDYSLLSKSISYPYFDFSASTNFFKNRLGCSLYFQNLLGNNATITRDTSFGDNFQQSRVSRNNFTNLLLTLTYKFGKKFENNLDDDDVENNDLRK